ncbi:hypothetical protein SASPL_148609 [Salvia splendens]|uniref:Uncharacterized protein n=1 Tax=Salvia splendens TaxID=180675 RepID=A0A8X8WAZ5_SALSN|nr:hypothetical protein SASPL_148609 [Salvia splendens]
MASSYAFSGYHKKLSSFFKILATSADEDGNRLCVNSAVTEISSDRCAISPRANHCTSFRSMNFLKPEIIQGSIASTDSAIPHWRGEKNAFEWGLSGIPHSEDAIQVSQQIANFLVREARMSLNRPSSQEVLDNLI